MQNLRNLMQFCVRSTENSRSQKNSKVHFCLFQGLTKAAESRSLFILPGCIRKILVVQIRNFQKASFQIYR